VSEKVISEARGPEAAPLGRPASRHLLLQRKCACGGDAGREGQCEACAGRSLGIQRRASIDGTASNIPASVERTLARDGRALDPDTRGFMEQRFNRDFGDVKVHDDADAARSARDVDAHAYTVGSHIVFGEGQYRPSADGGRRLLAHELAHTIQQEGLRRAGTAGLVDQGPEYRRLEHEADALADAALRRTPLPPVARAARPVLSRAASDTSGQESPLKTKDPSASIEVDWLGQHTTHKVTPDATFQAPGERRKAHREDAYEVEPLFVPGTKGPRAIANYEAMQGKGLQATLQFDGGRTKAALWQERADTAELQKRWLMDRGWPGGKAADTLWESAGGDDTFPRVGGDTCQMDHIVELQIGGTNIKENIQALDAKQNRESGGGIRSQVFGLAQKVATDPKLSNKEASQITLRFTRVESLGPAEAEPAKCPPPKGKRTCLTVDACARVAGAVKDPKAKPKADYAIAAGGATTTLKIDPAVKDAAEDADAPILEDPANAHAAELIPGLLLETLKRKPKARDTVIATIDTDRRTRLPLSIDRKRGDIVLNVEKDGILKLAKHDVRIHFTYRYLSPGQITSLAYGADGTLEWRGEIATKVPFLGNIDVAYEKGELKLAKAIDPSRLRSPLPGVHLTKAEVALILAPEFRPSGTVALRAGPAAHPLATADITVTRDDAGLVARGVLNAHVPAVEKAEGEVTYRNEQWSGGITVESSHIKIPGIESGSLSVRIAEQHGLTAEGTVNLALPGGNKATLSLKHSEGRWLFVGDGTFKIPKLDDTQLRITYDGERLEARGRTGFTFHGLKGALDPLTYSARRGEEPRISGAGHLTIDKGRVHGEAKVHLLPSGRITGSGTVTVRITEQLKATAGITIDEQEHVRIAGQIRLERIELFHGFHGQKNLFDIEQNIPIPGASIPGVGGLMAKIGGGANVSYGIGPGVLQGVYIEAAFNPLDDNPNVEAGMGGQLSIPAHAGIQGYVKGGLALDATIAEVTGFITLTISINLGGGLTAEFKGRYKEHRFVIDAHAEIVAALVLGLGLDATARARLGLGRLSIEKSKTWALKHLEVPTGLEFKLRAPIHYASDEPFRPPTLDRIEFSPPPRIDPGDLLGRIFKAATTSDSEHKEE
jgi:hypothetical protein